MREPRSRDAWDRSPASLAPVDAKDNIVGLIGIVAAFGALLMGSLVLAGLGIVLGIVALVLRQYGRPDDRRLALLAVVIGTLAAINWYVIYKTFVLYS